ncbi:hypothetical protein D3C72_2436910 [compost metagenome]
MNVIGLTTVIEHHTTLDHIVRVLLGAHETQHIRIINIYWLRASNHIRQTFESIAK